MIEDNKKTGDASALIPRFAYELNRRLAKGIVSPKVQLAAAVLAFTNLSGEEQLALVNQVKAKMYQSKAETV